MDPKRQTYIYDQLLKLNIELNFSDIPTPAYIQEKIIQCNGYQITAEKFFIETTREYTLAERDFKIESMQLEMLRRQTLLNNDRVKSLPTGKEREAAVNDILEKENERLLKLENEFDAVKNILIVIKQKQSTLKGVNANIKVLVGLMEQQINRLNIGRPDDPEVREFARELAEIDEYEKEMNLDDIESSIEIPQSEDSGDEQQAEPLPDKSITSADSGQESIETGEDLTSNEISQEEPGESVALGELDLSNLELISNEESESEARSEQDTAVSDDQDINSVKVSDDEQQSELQPATDNSDESGQGTSDFEDEIASFLEEHDSSPFFTKDDDLPELESDNEKNSRSTDEESVAEEGSFSISDINIDISNTFEDNSESMNKEPPIVQVDLEDIGIDVGDLGTNPSTDTSSEIPSTKEKISTNEKKAGDNKKAEDTDIDLDLIDILSSLDE